MTHARGQSKTKYEPVIHMCKQTAENGVLLKEYRCVQACQVNYGKVNLQIVTKL